MIFHIYVSLCNLLFSFNFMFLRSIQVEAGLWEGILILTSKLSPNHFINWIICGKVSCRLLILPMVCEFVESERYLLTLVLEAGLGVGWLPER